MRATYICQYQRVPDGKLEVMSMFKMKLTEHLCRVNKCIFWKLKSVFETNGHVIIDWFQCQFIEDESQLNPVKYYNYSMHEAAVYFEVITMQHSRHTWIVARLRWQLNGKARLYAFSLKIVLALIPTLCISDGSDIWWLRFIEAADQKHWGKKPACSAW